MAIDYWQSIKNNAKPNTMYIAYSALRTPEQIEQLHKTTDTEQLERYRAYLDACNKHSQHLAIIQQHMPGWMPKFR